MLAAVLGGYYLLSCSDRHMSSPPESLYFSEFTIRCENGDYHYSFSGVPVTIDILRRILEDALDEPMPNIRITLDIDCVMIDSRLDELLYQFKQAGAERIEVVIGPVQPTKNREAFP